MGDVNYILDLNEKLMTLEHVIAGLALRDESPIYITQMTNLQKIVIGWFNKAMEESKMKLEPAVKGNKEPAATGEPDEEPAG